MEELDVEVLKADYMKYKIQNSEIESELRNLIKAKEVFPGFGKDEKWLARYRELFEAVKDEMNCFKKLKSVLTEQELNELSADIKAQSLLDMYNKHGLARFDIQEEQADYMNYNYVPENFDLITFETNEFAKYVLEEKDFFKKLDLVKQFAQKENNFFDTSVMYKAYMTKLFMNIVKPEGIDSNEVITASMMYTCKKIDSEQEIERIKNERMKDFEYLKSLGFEDRFCKMCVEHTRYNQPTENYKREPEGDILELIENYVGLTMHRENRLAFPIDEAMDLIENKNLNGKDNRYLGDFKEFINTIGGIKV